MVAKQKPEKMPEGYFGWALLDGERGHITLKDALHNLSAAENGASIRYEQGLVVGIISAFIACGMDYQDACQMVWQHLPRDVRFDRVPQAFQADLGFGE